MSIPKIIHYCWFGGAPLPKSAEKCIASWKKYCPDYEIIRWDESSFDVSCNAYCSYMYANKRWAFLTDYIRLKVVCDHGGIYLDTDVELLKPLDSILERGAWMARQHDELVATGLGFGAQTGHPFLRENMAYYEALSDFSQPKSCPFITTELLREKGLTETGIRVEQAAGLNIYPQEYFCPKNERTGLMHKTRNTVSIHHFDASWFEESWKEGQKKRWKTERRRYILQTPNRCLIRLLGQERYDQLKKILKR